MENSLFRNIVTAVGAPLAALTHQSEANRGEMVTPLWAGAGAASGAPTWSKTQQIRRLRKASGSSLMLAFALITMLMLELAMMSTVLTRSLGEEGATMSQNGVARSYVEHSLMQADYNTYVGSYQYGPSTSLDGCWGPSGSTLWCMFSGAGFGDGTVGGWLQSRRGSFYKIRGEARVGPVYLKANRWEFYQPCSPFGRFVLTLNSAAYTPVYNTRTGRFFFGTSGGQYLTWHMGTGLSTLATSVSNAGDNAAVVYEGNERVFFGQNNASSNFYTWAESTGLSTLQSGRKYSGYYSTVVDPTTGRVFWGDYDPSSSNQGHFYSWYNGSLTTIVNTRVYPGYQSTIVDPLTGRAFFGENTASGNFYTWLASSGLSTLLNSRSSPGYQARYMDSTTGRLFVGEQTSPSNFYSWLTSSGLSTLISGAASHTGIGYQNASVSPSTGRIFFGENYNTTNTSFMTWYSGSLTTILSTGYQTGKVNGSNTVTVSTYNGADRVFFTSLNSAAATNAHFLTWSAATGLSTILSNRPYLGLNDVSDSTTGRVFFAEQDPASSYVGNYYSWDSSTGISTLVSARNYLGSGNGAAAVQLYSSRVIFSEYANPGNVYTWNPVIGMTTLASGVNTPLNIFVDPSSGYTYMVAGTTTYIYQPGEMCMTFGY